MSITIENLVKRYPSRSGAPGHAVLDRLDLTVGAEEFLTVLGTSGCGKSTLLNCVAGLEPFEGTIEVRGETVCRPPSDAAVVFQAPHLLPWRTVAGNVRYGLEMQHSAPRGEWAERVGWALDLVGLADASRQYPRQLSGGMQQRVNIARALAVKPRVLLMDEPFGALDAITKERMQEQLQDIAVRERLTVVFITHDIAEAIYLGDRVAVMTNQDGPGRIASVHTVGEKRPRPLLFKRSATVQALHEELWKRL